MIIKYIDSQNNKVTIDIPKLQKRSNSFEMITFNSKKEFLGQFISLYQIGQKLVLFDKNHTQLLEFYKQNNINNFDNIEILEEDTTLLFFTSGSSGFPVGAFKTKTNLESEAEVLKKLITKNIKVEKVIVTVPFIHIYGILAGVILPLHLSDVELVIKEDFLPYEILHELKCGNSLVITTPIFIKALGQLQEDMDLSSSMFVSSTGPLETNDILLLQEKYKTKLIQLFGSTETGGIAYKIGSNKQWITLEGVSIEKRDERLCVESAFISHCIVDEKIKKLDIPFVTEDIIELENEGFELLGRTNKLIKIAGKRISALAIESLLEKIDGVEKAVVNMVYKKKMMRSEQIIITLETSKEIEKSLIKKKITALYGIVTIPFSVVYTNKIKLSSMGKKIIFNQG